MIEAKEQRVWLLAAGGAIEQALLAGSENVQDAQWRGHRWGVSARRAG
jgi:hypothetical protein